MTQSFLDSMSKAGLCSQAQLEEGFLTAQIPFGMTDVMFDGLSRNWNFELRTANWQLQIANCLTRAAAQRSLHR
jgi:hypothetical protein